LTPEQLVRGRKMLDEWWHANYKEPTVIGATEAKLHGKGRVELWRAKFHKAEKAEQHRIAQLLLNERK